MKKGISISNVNQAVFSKKKKSCIHNNYQIKKLIYNCNTISRFRYFHPNQV